MKGPFHLPELRRARYLPFLFIALSTLALALWTNTVQLQPPPYYGMELLSNGYVDEVDPEGAAARAGLRTGDRVLAVDGTPLFRLPSLYEDKHAGDRVLLMVRREAVQEDLPVVLGTVTPKERAFRLELWLVGLIFWVIGFGVWLFRPHDRAVRLFFLLAMAMAGLLLAEVLDPGIPGMILFSHLLRILPAPLLLHFYCLFPTALAPPWRNTLLSVTYGSCALMAVLSLSAPLWTVDLYRGGLWGAGQALELTILFTALCVLFRPQGVVSLDVRRRRRVLVAGMLLGVLPVLATSLTRLFNEGVTLFPYGWTVPWMALVPLAYAYAVVKGELGKLDLILNRGLVYGLLTACLAGCYGLLYWSLDRFLSTEPAWTRLLAGAVLFVTASALFVPARTRLQRWVDRLFYGGWYDYRTFVQHASTEISGITDMEQLLAQLEQAARTMCFKAGVLLWPSGAMFVPRGSYGFAEERLCWLCLPAEGGLLRYLRTRAQPCLPAEIRHALAGTRLKAPERHALYDPGIQVLVPFVSHGTLHGVAVMGEHQGGEGVEEEDLAILHTLAQQAAIACENMTLLASLRVRLAEVERVRDELAELQDRLAESREEERLHVARELHDGPVQDLYALNHGLEWLSTSVSDAAARTQLEVLRTSVLAVAQTLRGLCLDLRPPLLKEFGLEAALQAYIERFKEKHPGATVELSLASDGQALPEGMQLALFRVCQEALNNAVEHGKARQVSVRFEQDAEQVLLCVRDTGCGFVVPARWIELGRHGHLGLLGMAERVKALGGVLEVQSAPGAGTSVRVVVPHANEAAAAPAEAAAMAHSEPVTGGHYAAHPRRAGR